MKKEKVYKYSKERRDAMRLGWTPEKRKAISVRLTGKKHSAEHVEACRLGITKYQGHTQFDRDLRKEYSDGMGVGRPFTESDYTTLFNTQNGVCRICGKSESLKIKGTNCRLSIDHNHSTGKVRGLLCSKCNKGIGYFEDNLQNLINAYNYLNENK